MANLSLKTLFFVAIFFLLARPVFAMDEAGAAATLAYQTQSVGADERVERLRAFLASYDSPLANEAQTLVAEADRNNINWKLVAAIAGVESTFCKQIPANSYNCWGWGIFTGATDGVHFANWSDGITQVSNGLRTNYYDRGAVTLSDVGWKYAANGDSWSTHVRYFIDKIDEFTSSPEALTVSI